MDNQRGFGRKRGATQIGEERALVIIKYQIDLVYKEVLLIEKFEFVIQVGRFLPSWPILILQNLLILFPIPIFRITSTMVPVNEERYHNTIPEEVSEPLMEPEQPSPPYLTLSLGQQSPALG